MNTFVVVHNNKLISADTISAVANILDGEKRSTKNDSATFEIPDAISNEDPANDTSVFGMLKCETIPYSQKP